MREAHTMSRPLLLHGEPAAITDEMLATLLER
jgi:hypothetical protein